MKRQIAFLFITGAVLGTAIGAVLTFLVYVSSILITYPDLINLVITPGVDVRAVGQLVYALAREDLSVHWHGWALTAGIVIFDCCLLGAFGLVLFDKFMDWLT